MKALILMTLIYAAPLWAHAESAPDAPLFDIVTSDPTDKAANMALEVNPDGSIEKIVYNETDKPRLAFSVKELMGNPEAILKKGPVSVIQLSTSNVQKTSFNLTITYLVKFKAFGSSLRGTKDLSVYYEAPSNLYRTKDPTTGKLVTKIKVVIRMEGTSKKGIDHIETSL